MKIATGHVIAAMLLLSGFAMPVRAAPLTDAAHTAAGSCKKAAQHLAILVKSDWPSSDENTPGTDTGMVGLLRQKSPAGLVLGKARFKLAPYSKQAFIEQARHMPNPFTPSRALLKVLDETDGELIVSDLPGTNLFAANSIGGTAGCNTTVFFSIQKQRADVVAGPKPWENDVGGSCGLTRSFASVGGVSVIIDDNLDAGPSLASTLTLIPRGDGKWLQPCASDFAFAPHFDVNKTLNDWAGLDNWESNDCGAGGCEPLQRAALELVRQTQQDRAGVEKHLLAAMTGPQREEYRRLKQASDPPPDSDGTDKPETAASLTDKNPLLLPMLAGDRVLVAAVGHFTIGWRVYADWKVTVAIGEGDKTREIARFAIGMTQGPIAGVTVK